MDEVAVRSKLETLKSDLVRRLEAIGDDLSAPLDIDSDERSIQVENDEVLVAMREDGAAQIGAIDAALDRLARGTYGDCVRCHARIDKRRLSALPYTPLCADCARSTG